MPSFSPWVAKKAKLEIEGDNANKFWRFPGLSGVTKNQDAAPTETISSWDGDIVLTGEQPPPTLEFAGTADFLHRAMIKAQQNAEGSAIDRFRLVTDEVDKGNFSAIAANNITAVTGDTKFASVPIANLSVSAVGLFLKDGTDYYKVEEIEETNGQATAVILSKYSAATADRKVSPFPASAAIAAGDLVLPSLTIGPFSASVSAFNDLTQDGDTPFNFSMTLTPEAALGLPVITT